MKSRREDFLTSFRVTLDASNERQIVHTGEKLPEKAEKAFMNPFRLGPTSQISPRERQRRGNWTDHVVI